MRQQQLAADLCHVIINISNVCVCVCKGLSSTNQPVYSKGPELLLQHLFTTKAIPYLTLPQARSITFSLFFYSFCLQWKFRDCFNCSITISTVFIASVYLIAKRSPEATNNTSIKPGTVRANPWLSISNRDDRIENT